VQQDRIQPLPLPDEIIEASTDLVDPSPYQMRIDAYEDEEDLKQLANGIQRLGMDPIPKVRPSPTKAGRFQMMTGHRRLEAVRKYLKWKNIKLAVYRNLSEETVLFLVGEDNMARRNIYPYEKGKYFNLWKDKLPVENVAQLFGTTPKMIYSWMMFTNSVDELGDPLGVDKKNQLIKNATKPKLELLLQFKDSNDLVEACNRVANNVSVEDLQTFLVASLNNSARRSSSVGGTSSKPSGNNGGNNAKVILAQFKRLDKAKTFEELTEGIKGLKAPTLKTLDDYMQIKAQLDEIHNAKNKAILKIKKTGTMQVYHKLEPDGAIVCLHEQAGKVESTIRFRV